MLYRVPSSNFRVKILQDKYGSYKYCVMQDKQHGFMGINIFQYWFVPFTNSTTDETATQRAKDFYIGW